MNWIDEAERKNKLSLEATSEEEMKIEQIRKENVDRIEPFIEDLTSLLRRVEKLSPTDREPCMEIGTTQLAGTNVFEFYGSAYVEQKEIKIIKKGDKILSWRRIKFRIPDRLGLIKVNIYEEFVPDKASNKKKIKNKFVYKISSFETEQALNILSWIAFKENTEEFFGKLPKTVSGEVSGRKKKCFVATAVYGTPNCQEIDILRAYRDMVLENSISGRLFIRLYYFVSPPFAQIISRNALLRKIAEKVFVLPTLNLAKRFFNKF